MLSVKPRSIKIPTYEYICDTCESLFEEVLLDPEEAKTYQTSHPCIYCESIARRVMSMSNFQFKGTAGNSGSHDLDYPTLDKAVGRSSSEKWKNFYTEKEKRDKVRKEANQYAVTQVGNEITPTSPEKLKVRQFAIDTAKKAMKSGE